jgi:S-adenosylmethionine:tRNA-ribosyltransferase-isomerase (queuine synthetase)
MSDNNVLTTLSDAAYLNATEYKEHVEAMLTSYDNPTGTLGELVSQMADAFWWVKIYRHEKNNLIRY